MDSAVVTTYDLTIDSLVTEIAAREHRIELLRKVIDSLARERVRLDRASLGNVLWQVPVRFDAGNASYRADSVTLRRAAELWTRNSYASISVVGLTSVSEPDSVLNASLNAMAAGQALAQHGVSTARIHVGGVEFTSRNLTELSGNVVLTFSSGIAPDEPGIPEPKPADFDAVGFTYDIPSVSRSIIRSVTRFMTRQDWRFRFAAGDSLVVISQYVREPLQPGERIRQAAYMLAIQARGPRCSRIVFKWRVESRGDLEPAFVRQHRDRDYSPSHRSTIRRFLDSLGECAQ